MTDEEYLREHSNLLTRIKTAKPKLLELCANADREFGAPDLFYRFYYQSFKVYRIQKLTEDFLEVLRDLAAEKELNSWFLSIVKPGLGKTFDLEHNHDWLVHTRPMMEAYFHTRMVVDQMIWCADNMEEAGGMLPSPWAAVLMIFNLR